MIRRALILVLAVCWLPGPSTPLGAQQKQTGPALVRKPTAPAKRRPAKSAAAAQAIKVTGEGCRQRLTIGSDDLFGDEKWTITSEGEEVMAALGTMIENAGEHPIVIEGHTDNSGSAASNLRISETRAQAVKNWLYDHEYIPFKTPIRGYGGNRPVAANSGPSGSDGGKALSRRIEVLIDTCHDLGESR